MKYISFTSVLFAVYFFLIVPAYGQYDPWPDIQLATQLEAENKIEEASAIWGRLVSFYEGQTDPGSYINAAIYHKKLGAYYDGIKSYDEAVYHYEKENEYWSKAGQPSWGVVDMIRADQIRTTYDFFVKIPGLSDQKLVKFEPENGFYAGIYCENDPKVGQNLAAANDLYGEHKIFLFYQFFGEGFDGWWEGTNYFERTNFPVEMGRKIKSLSSAIQVSMSAGSGGLEGITQNSWILQWAEEARDLGIPIFLRFLPEMNGDWAAGLQNGNGRPELFKEKFRSIHDLMAEIAPNVVMVWCPNDVPVELNGIRLEDYYPGDDYVDWVGVNFYIDYYEVGNVNLPDNRLQNPLDHLKYIYELYATRKPIMVCETGVSHYSLTAQADLSEWASILLQKLYTYLPIKYPRVKAITYFSLNQANPNYPLDNVWNNYCISENELIETTYQDLLKNQNIVKQINGNSGVSYKKMQEVDLEMDLSEYRTLIFDVKIPDYKVSRVECWISDELIAVLKNVPYTLRFSAIPGTYSGSVRQVTVKVFDSKNVMYSKKVINLAIPEKSMAMPWLQLLLD
jgi:hypothetical protein